MPEYGRYDYTNKTRVSGIGLGDHYHVVYRFDIVVPDDGFVVHGPCTDWLQKPGNNDALISYRKIVESLLRDW